MQFTSGDYRGRIFVPANHSAGAPQPEFRDYTAHGFFTDDHGQSFSLGQSVPEPGSNESTAAELGDGRLMMNIRNQRGDIRARIVALSSDGGATWDSVGFDKNLPDPVCEGAILAVGVKKKKNILAFCNAADTRHRDNLTLRISYDEGKTWPIAKVIDKAMPGEESNYTAYSDLVKIGKRRIGVLYERKNYSSIVFRAVKW